MPTRTPVRSLLLLALASACSGQPRLAPVSSVIVRAADLTPVLEEAGIDARTAIDATNSALAGAGFEVDKGARRGYRATLEVVAFSVLVAGAGNPSKAEVVVELELQPGWATGPAERRSGRAAIPFTGGNQGGAWRQAFEGAVAEAARGVALDLRAQQKSAEGLVADLGDPDPRVKERALRALAARGARGAARSAAACIHDPDPEVARAAVDALVAFRDPTTVRFLIEAAQVGGVATTVRLIPVLDEIGGADVEGYLLTLQSGHGDRAVRQAAGEALARTRGGAAPGQGVKR